MNNTDTKIIKVHGKNIDNFFQNIITNDIKNLNTENPIYTAMLSPQGKYLYDFFILKEGNFFKVATKALVIKARGVIFFFSPVCKSFSEFLKFSISVTSASSWFVT